MQSVEDFSAVSNFNEAETAALRDLLHSNRIMQCAHVIAGKVFRAGDYNAALDLLPEGELLAGAWLAAAFLSFDFSRQRFQELGFPENLWRDTMTDLVIWLRHEKRNSGVTGLGKKARLWTAHLYRGDVLRFGRLECNQRYFFKYEKLLDNSGNILVAPGEPVINLHIPEDGSMKLELCSRSVKAMAEFFARRYPEYNWRGMICTSWLCDTQLADMLPAESNIVKFQSLGIHFPVDVAADTVFRVFGNKDPFTLEKPTLLQRKAAEFLKNNGVFREEGLFISRNDLEAVEFDLDLLLEKKKKSGDEK